MRPIRVYVVMLFVALMLLSSAPSAMAHAAYKSSDPPSGGRVSSPPGRVTAEFTEPLAEGSYLQVIDPCGEQVDNGDVSISGFTMSVTMSGGASGEYVVRFKAFSQLDPHVTTGDFSFTASSGEPCAAAAAGPAPGSNEPGTSGEGGETTQEASISSGSSSGATGGGRETSRESAERSGSFSRGKDLRPQDQRARVPNLLATADLEPEPKPVWDGIELDSFLTGLLLAAIIGAAGGKIYAGIMGPRA